MPESAAEYQARMKEESKIIRQEQLANFKATQEYYRGFITGQEPCGMMADAWFSSTQEIADRPEVVELFIEVVEKSTSTECIHEGIDQLGWSLVAAGKQLPKEQVERAGKLLESKLAHPDRAVHFFAAQALNSMGGPYGALAYKYYANILQMLLIRESLSDEEKDKAIEAIGQLIDWKHPNAKRLIRKITQRHKLLERWEIKYSGTAPRWWYEGFSEKWKVFIK